MGVDHALGHAGDGKGAERAAHVAIGVPVRQPTRKDHGQQGAGNDAQFAHTRNSPRKPPVGDGDAHAALDDDWMCHKMNRQRYPGPTARPQAGTSGPRAPL